MPQEFDPHAYAAAPEAADFDPHAYAMPDQLPKPEPSEAEAAMRGAAHGITFGFADEASAGVNALRDYLSAKAGLRGDIDLGTAYQTNLGAIRSRDQKAQEANPWAYGGGELAGTVMSPVGKALAGGKTIGGVMLRGAAGGALSGAGESTANTFESPEELEHLAEDTLKGAGLGASMAGATTVAGKVLSKLAPEELKKFARERIVKAATGQNLRAIKQMQKTGAADASGSALDAAGRILAEADEAGAPAVGWFSKAEEILPRAKEKQEFFGKRIGDVASAIDEAMPGAVDAKKISGKILDYAASIPETEQTKPIIERLLREANRLEGRGNISFSEAQDLKNTFKFKPMDSSTHTFGQDASNRLNSIFKDEMNQTADQIASVAAPDSPLEKLASQYRDSKTRYQAYKNAADAAEKRAASNVSNRFPSPSDYYTSGTALLGSLVHGGSLGKATAIATATGIGNKLARERGSAFAGHAAGALGNLMERVPESVGTVAGAAQQALSNGTIGRGATQLFLDSEEGMPELRQRRLDEMMRKRQRDLAAQGYFP